MKPVANAVAITAVSLFGCLAGCASRFHNSLFVDAASSQSNATTAAAVADPARSNPEVAKGAPGNGSLADVQRILDAIGNLDEPKADTKKTEAPKEGESTAVSSGGPGGALAKNATPAPPIMVRIGTESAGNKIARGLDLLSPIALPVGLLLEIGRFFVIEDADSYFHTTTWDNYLVFADEKDVKEIGVDDPFVITIDTIAIDNFTEGRLRDSWGGKGGEVSFQASINALSPTGQLLADDRKFLVTDQVKRRSPVLAALRATERGRVAVEEIEERAEDFLEKVTSAGKNILDQVNSVVKEIDDFTKPEKLKEARAKLKEGLERLLGSVAGKEWDKLEQQLAQFITDKVLEKFDDLFRADMKDDELTAAKEKFKKKIEEFLEKAQLAAEFFDKFGVDEEGLFERAEIIKGLANADHLTTLEFSGVRPSVLWGGALTDTPDPRRSGTAEIVFQRKEIPTLVKSSGVIYRGTLKELADTSTASNGFSLSLLMLERDSDKVAQALRYVQQYADSRDIEIGSSGIEAAAVVDALAIIAERIAEDDVELKLLDLRLFSGEPQPGGAPGRDLYMLKPCQIVVARNLDGNEFGALAVIGIRRTDESKAH